MAPPGSLGSARALGWDLCLARRAAAVGGVLVLLTLVIVAATDAGGTLATRVGMTAALAPLSGAVGALVALWAAAAAGELRALAAVGADPFRAARGAVLGGVAVGALGVLVAASGAGDLGVLFPRLAARAWVVEGAGVRELSLGLRVAPGGLISLVAPVVAPPPLPEGTVLFTLIALGAAAVAGPAWIAVPGLSAARRVGVAVLALASAVVAFQAVAAGRLSPLALVVSPALLLTDGLLARYRAGLDGNDDRLAGG
jgi:hypothetical protein